MEKAIAMLVKMGIFISDDRDSHIEPDWLMLYEVDGSDVYRFALAPTRLILTRQ